MTSAELAQVEEITAIRMFTAAGVTVMYNTQKDTLYCNKCMERDSCDHTARVRLSGKLTHTVTPDVPMRKHGLSVSKGGAA